jgi:hypothetical protein
MKDSLQGRALRTTDSKMKGTEEEGFGREGREEEEEEEIM